MLPITLSASAFVDDDGNTHEASWWIIKNASGDSVYSGSFDRANKISFTVPPGTLQANTQYYWQVIYRDDRGVVSSASAPTSFTASKPAPGDVNGNGDVTIADAILALQLLSNQTPAASVKDAAINNDGKIGLPEVIYILQSIAGYRLEASDKYFISGKITAGGFAEAGATVALSGAATAPSTTDGNGNYTFANLLNGS